MVAPLPRLRHGWLAAQPVRVKPAQPESAAQRTRGKRRFRGTTEADCTSSRVPGGHQRSDRKVKIFQGAEICAEAVLASACLPFLFQAVEIDGEHYWDGGYTANPAIFPLIYSCDSRDVAVVHISPIERPELPRTARDILNRVNEISFNSSPMREMRVIHFCNDVIESSRLEQGARVKRMLIHAISADGLMTQFSAGSKLNSERGFLAYLRDHGRSHPDALLQATFEELGQRSTVEIESRYL
jgi:NTE family protein